MVHPEKRRFRPSAILSGMGSALSVIIRRAGEGRMYYSISCYAVPSENINISAGYLILSSKIGTGST